MTVIIENLRLAMDSIVSAVPEQVSCELDGETIILALNSGKYFSLNSVGARIWELIQKPTQVTVVHQTLQQEYDVDPEQCQREVLVLLQNLAEHQLVRVRNSGNV